jgi:hypothetical protein
MLIGGIAPSAERNTFLGGRAKEANISAKEASPAFNPQIIPEG